MYDVKTCLALAADMYDNDYRVRLDRLIIKLFPEQRKFLFDESKRKAAICSRRAGKSYVAGCYLIREALSATEGDVAYIGITHKSAKSIMFRHVRKINEDYQFGLISNIAELTFTNPANGNTIFITGAHNEDDTEKLRGHKLNLAMLDECASFKSHLNYLIEEVIEPTLIDNNGTLALIGTPSANPSGNYFHKVTGERTEGFSIHKWTILNNPYIRHAATWLEEYRKRKGWDETHPIYQREWMGLWTTNSDSLVYRYNREKNDYSTLPTRKWNYVIGVDLGYNDAFAVVVWAYSGDSKELYSVEQFKQKEMTPSQMAAVIKGFMNKYGPISIVGDYGGLGKAICKEFISRYHIPIKPAEKQNKLGYIELLNGDLIAGHVKIRHDSDYVKEMSMLQWDADKKDKEDPRTPNDMCDAGLYGYREARHFIGEVPDTPPVKDSKEYWDKYQKELEQKEIEEFQRRQEAEKDGDYY